MLDIFEKIQSERGGLANIHLAFTDFPVAAAGFNKAQWLHSVMVISYFNMANRIAFATGIELEDDFQQTCR